MEHFARHALKIIHIMIQSQELKGYAKKNAIIIVEVVIEISLINVIHVMPIVLWLVQIVSAMLLSILLIQTPFNVIPAETTSVIVNNVHLQPFVMFVMQTSISVISQQPIKHVKPVMLLV